MSTAATWPELQAEEWAPTRRTLQLCTQMLGKVRLALSPPQPEWLHACLYLDGRGFVTGPLSDGTRTVSLGIDVFRGLMWIRASDGSETSVSIGPDRCIAWIWAEFIDALESMGLELDLWDKPQEMADATPFSENTYDCTFVPDHAQRFLEVLSAVNGVFEEFRSPFFGRSGIQFWWGAFDYAVLLFSGKHLDAPEDKGYIMHYDLDAEHFNAGFWPGDESAPAAFYAYLVPRPDGCETAPIEPEHAGWVEAMGEWMLPYEAVRACEDPRRAVLDFLESVYRIAVAEGGWDAAAFEYAKPAPPKRA